MLGELYTSEKGTNRKDFINGKVNKYSWVDLGSSFLPSELQSAHLYSQLKQIEYVTNKRIDIWNKYHNAFSLLEEKGIIRRASIPEYSQINGHMYYILLRNTKIREEFIKKMAEVGIQCTTHYVPLHLTPYGKKFIDQKSSLKITEDIHQKIVRLPLWIGLEKYQEYIIDNVINYLEN